jgi:hypothetical protein
MSARAVIAWLVIRAVLCQKMIPPDNHRSQPSATPCRAVWIVRSKTSSLEVIKA